MRAGLRYRGEIKRELETVLAARPLVPEGVGRSRARPVVLQGARTLRRRRPEVAGTSAALVDLRPRQRRVLVVHGRHVARAWASARRPGRRCRRCWRRRSTAEWGPETRDFQRQAARRALEQWQSLGARCTATGPRQVEQPVPGTSAANGPARPLPMAVLNRAETRNGRRNARRPAARYASTGTPRAAAAPALVAAQHRVEDAGTRERVDEAQRVAGRIDEWLRRFARGGSPGTSGPVVSQSNTRSSARMRDCSGWQRVEQALRLERAFPQQPFGTRGRRC